MDFKYDIMSWHCVRTMRLLPGSRNEEKGLIKKLIKSLLIINAKYYNNKTRSISFGFCCYKDVCLQLFCGFTQARSPPGTGLWDPLPIRRNR